MVVIDLSWIQAEFNYIRLGIPKANIYALHSINGRAGGQDLGKLKQYIFPKHHNKLAVIHSQRLLWAAWNPHCVGEYAPLGPFEVAQGKVQELYRLENVIVDSHPDEPGGWTWRLMDEGSSKCTETTCV